MLYNSSFTLFFSAKYFIFILLITACQGTPDPYEYIDSELEALVDNQAKYDYLLALGEDDKKFRRNQTSDIILQFGRDSKEMSEFQQEVYKQDAINLIKVEKYLDRFGYPKNRDISVKARNVIFSVVHHNLDIERKKKLFPTLYKAWQTGDLDNQKFGLYLNGMHEHLYGSQYTPTGTFQETDRIDSLIRKLELQIPG